MRLVTKRKEKHGKQFEKIIRENENEKFDL